MTRRPRREPRPDNKLPPNAVAPALRSSKPEGGSALKFAPTGFEGISMKICIYGAGAIGGHLGVQLARAGADVSLVARGAHLAAMRENGLKLLIGDEERVVRPRCTDNPAELGPQDFVIICLKGDSSTGVIN